MSSSTDVEAGPDDAAPRPPTGRRGHRVWWIAGLATLLFATGLTVVLLERRTSPADGEAAAGPLPWTSGVSGAAGYGPADEEFGEWRGRPPEIIVTWANDNDAMVYLSQLRPDGEYADWDKALDMSLGAISEEESWAEAADGEYDDRWRESLTRLRDYWGDRTAPLYIRFAHEINGDWYPWSVESDETDDFKVAWERFKALQEDILPDASLVFCVGRQTAAGSDLDWRDAYPGAEYVDVFAVDYYNFYPASSTEEEWAETAQAVGDNGEPEGIEQFRQFAEDEGLPLAVPEWGGFADSGDHPAFVEGMHAFFTEHAGDGPGELLYEALYDVPGGPNDFVLSEDTRMPEMAETYRRLW